MILPHIVPGAKPKEEIKTTHNAPVQQLIVIPEPFVAKRFSSRVVPSNSRGVMSDFSRKYSTQIPFYLGSVSNAESHTPSQATLLGTVFSCFFLVLAFRQNEQADVGGGSEVRPVRLVGARGNRNSISEAQRGGHPLRRLRRNV